MKIAYLLPEIACTNGRGDGIRNQAWTWASGLRSLGAQVEFLGPWSEPDWRSFDLVHFFSYYAGFENDARYIKNKFNIKIAVSPIVDSNRSPWMTRAASYLHAPRFHMYSPLGSLRKSRDDVDGWLVRSSYEGNYIQKAFGVSESSIFKVMLSTRIDSELASNDMREDFCLLVCYLPSVRKNVMRLIQAAIIYGFRLVLVGSKISDEAYAGMMKVVEGHPNIEVRGWLPDEDLIKLYRRARVFALPSLYEGVGLVALEAASCGCDIVLTDRGAPKEYYNGMAALVDPLSVDAIGLAVKAFMEGKTYQPTLSNYIRSEHSQEKSAKELYAAYRAIIEGANR